MTDECETTRNGENHEALMINSLDDPSLPDSPEKIESPKGLVDNND